jgi:hypothetical protein
MYKVVVAFVFTFYACTSRENVRARQISSLSHAATTRYHEQFADQLAGSKNTLAVQSCFMVTGILSCQAHHNTSKREFDKRSHPDTTCGRALVTTKCCEKHTKLYEVCQIMFHVIEHPMNRVWRYKRSVCNAFWYHFEIVRESSLLLMTGEWIPRQLRRLFFGETPVVRKSGKGGG